MALLVVCNACALLSAFQSPYVNYRNYVEGRLQIDKKFDRAKQIISVQVLVVTERLMKLQSELSRGPTLDFKPNSKQLIVAINAISVGPLMTSDLQFTLGSRRALSVREISDKAVLDTFYFFAKPFYQVFTVEFSDSSKNEETLEIANSVHRFSTKVTFAEKSEMKASL